MLLAQLSKDHRRQGDDISIDYVQKLLDAFGAEEELTPLPARAEISPVKLTPRELEVLQHLAGGLAYADIAAQLVITENTLKYHIKNIYGKLNVNNRMQAVATARQLSLL
jgi:LuxR family maltose regulon positive regulatory protein